MNLMPGSVFNPGSVRLCPALCLVGPSHGGMTSLIIVYRGSAQTPIPIRYIYQSRQFVDDPIIYQMPLWTTQSYTKLKKIDNFEYFRNLMYFLHFLIIGTNKLFVFEVENHQWTTQSYTKCFCGRPNHIPNAFVDDPIGRSPPYITYMEVTPPC